VYEEYKRLVRYHTEWRKLARHTVEVYINELETYKLIQRVVGKGRGRGKGREPTCIITTFDVKKFEEMLKR
jgi:CDC6, C terminal.